MTFTTDHGIGILAVSESVVLLVAAAYGLGSVFVVHSIL